MLLKANQNGHIDCSKVPNYSDQDIPDGYTIVREHFVDNSGFGQVGESALTVDQFQAEIIAGRYYAITDIGQFQLYVTEYTKD